MAGNGEILSLTGLRFIAALYVFLFHIQIRWPITNIPFLKNILDQGATGMSVFFMLSGFLLAYRYVNADNSLKDYLVNRFARIYPVYIVVAITTLPWLGIDFFADKTEDLIFKMAQALLLVMSNIFLIQAWFPQFFSYWNDGGSWSISVEVFCYLLLPFILPRLALLSLKNVFLVAVLCWVFAILPGLSFKLFSGPSFAVFYAMPIFRFPEFLLGVCVFLFLRKAPDVRCYFIFSIIVPLIVLIYLGYFGPVMPIYVGHNWLILPAVGLMLSALACGKGPVSALLATTTFVWLGKISYCFYSFQVVMILMLMSHYDKLVAALPVFANGKLLAASAFMMLVVLSAVGYYLIEEPARYWIRHKYKKRKLKLKKQQQLRLLNEGVLGGSRCATDTTGPKFKSS